MRIASAGHLAFAAVFMGLGVQGLVTGQFTAVGSPVPKDLPGRDALAYLCACVSLASGAGLLWKRTAASAARVLLAYSLLWCLMFRLRPIFRAPGGLLPWYGLAEPVVMIAGAWV